MKFDVKDAEKIWNRSHLVRGAWIEIPYRGRCYCKCTSHLVRGAWIEILWPPGNGKDEAVAPRERCVD